MLLKKIYLKKIGQESPAKRLRQEAEPLKRDSQKLTHTAPAPANTQRPHHHKSSPNVAARKSGGYTYQIFNILFIS